MDEMIRALVDRKRGMTRARSGGLAILLVFVMASCGGSNSKHSSQHQTVAEPARSTIRAPAPPIQPADAVPMTATPRKALALCRQSKLLRLVCPRRVPLSLDPTRYDLADGCANAPGITIASDLCTLPGWSYETFAPLPRQRAGTLIRAWDGTAWFTPSYATMIPPPYHVHVDIEASTGSPPPSIAGPSFARAEAAHRPTDGLLNPSRDVAAAFGWVRWYGRYGQLRLAPTGADGGGEQAGHLIFYFTAGDVGYDISLHAWASEARITSGRVTHVIMAPEPGPAMPYVIATLKAIVGSALNG